MDVQLFVELVRLAVSRPRVAVALAFQIAPLAQASPMAALAAVVLIGLLVLRQGA
jgi:hypothetical protein